MMSESEAEHRGRARYGTVTNPLTCTVTSVERDVIESGHQSKQPGARLSLHAPGLTTTDPHSGASAMTIFNRIRRTWTFRVLGIIATGIDLYAAHKFGAF